MPSSNRSRLTAWLLLAGMLLVGIIAGVALDRFALIRQHRLAPPPRPVATERVLERLDRRLDLTPAQEAEIRTILDRRRVEMDRVWEDARPRVAAQMKATQGEIEQVLDPQQRRKFRQMAERWRQFADRRGRR